MEVEVGKLLHINYKNTSYTSQTTQISYKKWSSILPK